MTFDRHDDLQDRFLRTVAGGRVSGPLRHHVPASEAFVEAVVAGLGLGMVPRARAEPRLAAGTLVDLDPGHPVDVPLFWQQWKLAAPGLDALAGAVIATAASSLDGASPSHFR